MPSTALPDPPVSVSVSVCICTYRRPAGLRRALQSVLDAPAPPGHRLELLVVDNDPQGSAAAVVASLQAVAGDAVLRYLHEPTPGVSHARNRCLDSATADLLAFIDDDEYTDPQWLPALLACLEHRQADAVLGPVLPQFEAPPSPWLQAAGVNDRQRYPTGTVLPWQQARTGNVLMRRSLFAGGHRFSTEFARTGGEDSLFFASAQQRGKRLVWCDEALVHESVPAQRMQPAWVLQRAFMGGRTYVRLEARRGHRWPYTYFALRGMAAAALSALAVAALYPLGGMRHVRHQCKLYGHLGKVCARFYSDGPYAGQP